ncbi:MAG: S-adenosylmethionine decarboxylase [bacterium]|nr:S-adenosylmethionine decarboxylase [bacterium]
MFDLYLDTASNSATAFSAETFDRVICGAIRESGMTLRKSFIDAWKSAQEGPASLFYSLEESHVRIETWPEENHVQGEVQLCNYSKDNADAARQLAKRIISALNPATTQVLFINRGPGPNVAVRKSVSCRNR